MRQSSGSLLHIIGGFWPGLVLVSLILSTPIEAARHFILSLSLPAYLGAWVLALSPSVILLWLAERGTSSDG